MPLVDLPERLGAGRLAMALVSAVPAGLYGKAALENAEVWERVSPRVVQTDNVRAALALVAIKEAALGIVYATDATPEPRVTIVTDISPDMHPPITYPIARIRTAAEPGADALLAFLTGPEAAPFFTAQGFAVLME